MSWDPAVYLSFNAERLRPAQDLLARTPVERPARVMDLGCGPGNSTALLRARWPAAALEGLDASEAMLRKARGSGVDALWRYGDIAAWRPDDPYDVIFANASLQWIDDHQEVFPRLVRTLTAGGALAVQMPDSYDGPARQAVADVLAQGWSCDLTAARTRPPVAAPQDYYEWLAPHSARLDIWRTAYLHALQGPDAVFHWVRGAALTPYLDQLDGEERRAFEEAMRRRLSDAFPPRASGETLFEFHRLFIVAAAVGDG